MGENAADALFCIFELVVGEGDDGDEGNIRIDFCGYQITCGGFLGNHTRFFRTFVHVLKKKFKHFRFNY